jgi:Kdo2-lipid IVA lauroyltransferase/acyltransferase
MASWQKRVEGHAATWFLRRLMARLERASDEEVERLGRKWARRLVPLSRRRLSVALENLARAFPDSTPEWREETARASVEHFAIVFADFLGSRRWSLEYLESTNEVHNLQAVDEALALGKGMLLPTGHFGHFERASAYLAFKGYPISVVIRDADDEGVNAIVNGLRQRPGTKIIPRGNAARPIIEALRRNEIVGILSDQNHDDAYLPFFGVPAGTNLGMGVIQERTGAPAVATLNPRVGPGRYAMRFDRLDIGPPTDTKGEAALTAINRYLEDAIREYPEQWLWIHDRWRSAKRRGLA